ncbi:MAG TPA: DNA polymerase/3'-5' exonuclease PolX [Steroidobacteraceae bacterium]|nr:DNA polymerase/3'-5' exonuclease PolX [Steroidobacteraceae bacterium]
MPPVPAAIHNEDVANVFDSIADLLAVRQDNAFRIRAYRNAARVIRGLGSEVSEMISTGKDLDELPGVGKDLAAQIREIVSTGTSSRLKKIEKSTPATLGELLRIPSLGPKRVSRLYHELGIRNVQELEQAVRDGKLQSLKGFGEKMQERILDVLQAQRVKKPRMLHNRAGRYVASLLESLRHVPGTEEVVLAGSYRRGRETVGDIDMLASASRPQQLMDAFIHHADVSEVLAQGPARATVLLHNGLQVDLRVIDKESFGAALLYFTGSKAHNIELRRRAKNRGLKINEYGVFRGKQRVAGETETSVYQALGLPFIPSELREMQGEFAAAEKNALPVLVERASLKGDLHAHTDATDGQATLEQMAQAAQTLGFEYLGITDHSSHTRIAHGLDGKHLLREMEAIDKLNASLQKFTILKGIEVDILEDGSLDMPDDVLRQLDFVIGAVHSNFGLSREKQTARLLRAMDHPYFSILAHPTGRLLGEREPYAVDIERVIHAAHQRGCFIELNSQPQRLDLQDNYCRVARDAGVLIAISSDAHGTSDFSFLDFGVVQARRGWLGAKDVLNTRPLAQLRKLLKATFS